MQLVNQYDGDYLKEEMSYLVPLVINDLKLELVDNWCFQTDQNPVSNYEYAPEIAADDVCISKL